MDQFVVVPFVAKGKGVKASVQFNTKSANSAIAEAECLGALCGAAALHIDFDEECGVTRSVKVLARVGNLPEDFDETIGA
jgi:hypothetical protein